MAEPASEGEDIRMEAEVRKERESTGPKGRKGTAKEGRWPLEAGKSKGMDSPLELLERT